jgi:4-amino-4-deoxy-L-arabinose transferase-like glycosyltransferase
LHRKTLFVFLFSILILALLVRLAGIATRPLWYDEAFSVLFAEKGLVAILVGTLGPAASDLTGAGSASVAEEHPLLYYILLSGWMRIFGQAPAVVRALSVLFGLVTVALVFFLGLKLFDIRSAAVMATLVAISPFQVHYSQEVRMYAALAAFILLAALSLWMGMKGRRRTWWVIFAISAAFAQYTHSIAVIYLLLLALTPVFARRWKDAVAVGLAGLGAIALYLPWLARLPSQLGKIQDNYWMEVPSPGRLVTALLSYVTNLPVPEGWLPAALFISLSLLVLAAWQTLRLWRKSRQADGSGTGNSNLLRGLWLAYLAFTPLLALYLVSQVQPVFVERALLPAGVFFWMWIGWALVRTDLPRPAAMLAAAVLLAGVAIGMFQHISYNGFPYGPYNVLGDSLAGRLESGDVIVHSNKLSLLPLIYTHRDLPQRYVVDPPGSSSDTLGIPTRQVLGLQAESSIEAATHQAPRVWLIIFSRAIQEYQDAGNDTHPHLAWLASHYPNQAVERWGDLMVYRFSRSPGEQDSGDGSNQ